MTSSKYFIGGLLVLMAIALGFIFGNLTQIPSALGEAFTGSISQIDTATTTTVGPDTIVTIFSKGTECDARVVTTSDAAVRLGFGTVTGFTVSATAGHIQAASTTVVYDSGLYGCGNVTAYGWSSTTLTVSEF